jgi:hypothetical protein
MCRTKIDFIERNNALYWGILTNYLSFVEMRYYPTHSQITQNDKNYIIDKYGILIDNYFNDTIFNNLVEEIKKDESDYSIFERMTCCYFTYFVYMKKSDIPDDSKHLHIFFNSIHNPTDAVLFPEFI